MLSRTNRHAVVTSWLILTVVMCGMSTLSAGPAQAAALEVTELTWNDGTANITSTNLAQQNIINASPLVSFKIGSTTYNSHMGSNSNSLSPTTTTNFFYGDNNATPPATASAALTDNLLDTGALNIATDSNFFFPTAPTSINDVLFFVETGNGNSFNLQLTDGTSLIGSSMSYIAADWDVLATHDANTVTSTLNALTLAIPLSDFVTPAELSSVMGLRVLNNSSNDPMYVGISSVAAVPEPSSIMIWSLIGVGLLGFGWRRLRRR